MGVKGKEYTRVTNWVFFSKDENIGSKMEIINKNRNTNRLSYHLSGGNTFWFLLLETKKAVED